MAMYCISSKILSSLKRFCEVRSFEFRTSGMCYDTLLYQSLSTAYTCSSIDVLFPLEPDDNLSCKLKPNIIVTKGP
jgi:hypothetical protein